MIARAFVGPGASHSAGSGQVHSAGPFGRLRAGTLDKLALVQEGFAMFFATYLASIITHYEPIYKSLGVLVFLLVEVAFVGCVAIGFLQSGSGSDLSLPAFLLPGLFVTVAFAEIWSLFGGLVPRANPALILVAALLSPLPRCKPASSVREGIQLTLSP